MRIDSDSSFDYVVSLLEGTISLLKSQGEEERLKLLKYFLEMAIMEAREQKYRKKSEVILRSPSRK